MNLRAEAVSYYQQALKQGRKAHRQSVHKGSYPYLQVLDEILTDNMIAGEVNLGILEIPIEKIVGTKTRGRTTAFSSNFLPLLPEESEFGAKWCKLCEAHLGDTGITDPIQCYEYLGRFYVEEGNKRVSVMKFFGSSTIAGKVIRLLPTDSDSLDIQLYNEFLTFYPLTKLYQIAFTQLASFPKLQIALGYEVDHAWTEDERRRFLSGFVYFEKAFRQMGGESLPATTADALLVWLKVYPFSMTKTMSAAELVKSLQPIWNDIKSIGQSNVISVNTESSDSGEKRFTGLRPFPLFHSSLNVAFIHELTPETSNWVRAHEAGRVHLENVLGDRVKTQCFMGVGSGEDAETAMETAVQNGADVLFATTAPLIAPCRKIAARHPHVKVLNCSISMPYAGVRTYYSRIYEGKFISGAIAGALCTNDHIGYVASYPIFGVPAGINAFALGAQLTNPNARIALKWFSSNDRPIDELLDDGIDVISTLDIPMPGWKEGNWGTFQRLPDGTTRLIASPYWDWGVFYTKLVRKILNGDWESSKQEHHAVNYWWGLASGVIGVEYTDAMPLGTKTLVDLLRNGIVAGHIDPFHRPIKAQDGTVKNDGSKVFLPEDILHMDWLCENVDGSIPPYESLNPKSQAIVRLQGIYRDQIPLQKESVLL